MAQTFPEVFTDFVARMNRIEDATVPFLGNALDGICELLRIGRLTATVYPDQKHEAIENGKTVTFFNGHAELKDEPYVSRRITQNDTVAVYRVFLRNDAAPWTPEEEQQMNLTLDTLFVFNGRARLLAFADRFTYMDNDGYRNYRYFIKIAREKSRLGLLTGMFAAQFNLKHFSLVNRQIGRALGTFVMRNFIDTLQEMITYPGQVCRIGGD
ncbi:MAG: hypothetical protein II916_04470, partial [Oscillospiraceae bacterium]|nr:hypothetical protein [Oscillospiraceae bacterium]